MVLPFTIQRIDARRDDVEAALDALRHKLSPAGNVVSEAGRRRTIGGFGEPLTPQQVAQRVCGGVKTRGLAAVPAQAAGVHEIAVVAPPTRFGANNPAVLATCHELGIREVYRIGGAQGVAALAYGVEGINKVDKIVGPGNLFVALAKRHVY